MRADNFCRVVADRWPEFSNRRLDATATEVIAQENNRRQGRGERVLTSGFTGLSLPVKNSRLTERLFG